MSAVEALFQRVEGARPEITVDDAKGAERQNGEAAAAEGLVRGRVQSLMQQPVTISCPVPVVNSQVPVVPQFPFVPFSPPRRSRRFCVSMVGDSFSLWGR